MRGRSLFFPILLACLPALGGCLLNNLDPSEKLNDSIRGMNDATRWGRIDLALQYIDPVFRERFLVSRHGWGRSIEVADSELLRIEMAPDRKMAVALVGFSWYSLDNMTLHSTVLRQVWKEREGHFVMDTEDVFEGDAKLVAVPASRPKVLADSKG
jgi:hypothetical protein